MNRDQGPHNQRPDDVGRRLIIEVAAFGLYVWYAFLIGLLTAQLVLMRQYLIILRWLAVGKRFFWAQIIFSLAIGSILGTMLGLLIVRYFFE